MPRGKWAKDWKKKHKPMVTADVTVQDFADCARPSACGRLKKSLSGSSSGGVSKALIGAAKASVEDGELEWFEKDLEDFVIEESPGENEEEEDLARKGASALKDKTKSKQKDNTGGKVFPADLWYILSEYIHPEDISCFARICHDAYQVTQLSSFWRKLYFRHYKNQSGLPAHVKPASMERLHGLKARVIRSLFILYPSLASRVQTKGPMDDEPHALKGHRCLVMWHQPAPKGWQFCFKFQKPTLTQLSNRVANKMDVYHGFNDLHYNPEEGCSVLQVTCCHFSSDAAVMGLILTQVYVTLSTGFRHHRLRLHFDTRVTNSHNSPCDNIVVLDDVVAIKVFKWFHPSYPFVH